MGSWGLKVAPRWPKTAPREAQERPKTAPRAPKSAPRRPPPPFGHRRQPFWLGLPTRLGLVFCLFRLAGQGPAHARQCLPRGSRRQSSCASTMSEWRCPTSRTWWRTIHIGATRAIALARTSTTFARTNTFGTYGGGSTAMAMIGLGGTRTSRPRGGASRRTRRTSGNIARKARARARPTRATAGATMVGAAAASGARRPGRLNRLCRLRRLRRLRHRALNKNRKKMVKMKTESDFLIR